MPDNKELLAAMKRIERKLDQLLAALAEEADDDEPELTLDGQPAGATRQQGLVL
jgi:hypothetical protein